MTTNSVSSPCIGICTLDEASKTCTACFRTLDEIIDWTSYSDEEKQVIKNTCKSRRQCTAKGSN